MATWQMFLIMTAIYGAGDKKAAQWICLVLTLVTAFIGYVIRL